jgi:16S rRNA processing protein RimM
MAERICVARIGAAHGVSGEVRLFAFTEDPLAITRYGPLEDKAGMREFKIASLRAAKDHLIARLEGVADREAAAKLANVELYVARERLPAIEESGSFYRADLVGLRVETSDGREFGTVVAVQNYGAGDLLEIAHGHERVALPFVEAFVRSVDVAGGRIVADPPEGLFEPSPLVGESGEDRARRGPSRVRGGSTASNEAGSPLTRSSAGSCRRRTTLSHKGRG